MDHKFATVLSGCIHNYYIWWMFAFNNGLCTNFLRLRELKCSLNSLRLINRSCQKTVIHKVGDIDIFCTTSNGNMLKQSSAESVLMQTLITARKRSLEQGNVLSSVCQVFCPRGGGRAWQGGVCSGGEHCRGHAWQGEMRDRGRAWWGGVRGRYYEIQSMGGRYASYWNAFMFLWWFGFKWNRRHSLSNLFLKFKQCENVNIANFIYYGKTRFNLVFHPYQFCQIW